MDFELNDDQKALGELAARILDEKLPPDRIAALERSGEWFAAEVWTEFARSALIGAPLPEDAGGSGLGILEACLVLEKIGQSAAPLPYLPTVILGAMPVAEFGTAAQRERMLPRVLSGDSILTAALAEEGERIAPRVPRTTATRTGGAWRLRGEKPFVPAALLADRILVPARTSDRTVGVFLVARDAPGLRVERLETTSLEPQGHLSLDGVEVGDEWVLGDPEGGTAIVDWITRRAIAGFCALQAGVCEGAIRLTAKHVSEREQFGVKIGTFQAVAHRAADAFVDTTAITLTARQAAWRLSAGLPADDALSVAKFWAADGGYRVAHAAQHLHGGLGFDTDYPVHRYFRWTKVIELTLGSAADHLLRLGERIAAGDA